MSRSSHVAGLAALACAAALQARAASPAAEAPASAAEDPATVWNFGPFGGVSVYRPNAEARNVVLFASGDGGWNLGVVAMARRLVQRDAIVAGIDIRHYLAQLELSQEKCVSPAADFENLSRYLQSRLNLKQYLTPTLLGYSSGATLVYAALAEAAEGSFKGALSLGFCPDLELKKPLCKGSGIETTPRRDSKGALLGVDLLPSKALSGKWIALQGALDQVCAAAATQRFIGAVPHAEIILLPKVGHGYSVGKNWVPQYEAAYDRITAPNAHAAAAPPLAASVSDLPLTLVPSLPNTRSPWFAVFLSGDGGWVGLDRGVSAELAQHGIATVGWDSLQYFWSPRTPQGAAHDLDRVIRHFSQRWNRSHVLLIGYSQGADIMPFMVNRLPAPTRQLVGLTTLLGISDNALFEFHVANWLGNPGGGLPTAPELQHWRGTPYLCLYGAEDADSACEEVTGKQGLVVRMPGGHHFGGGYHEIAQEILSRLPPT